MTEDTMWRRSSYSSDQGGNCVEVGLLSEAPVVRDSKDPAGPWLRLTPPQWAAFIQEARVGRFG